MASQNRPLLLAAVCDFGWGSMGKLHLILEKLPSIEVTLYGNHGIVGVTKNLLGALHDFSERSSPEADVALVINDPAAADKIAGLGVPVLYVDSLPYLWATEDEIPKPQSVVYYCAQRFPSGILPLAAPLRGRPDIRWVEPIIPLSKGRRAADGIVVNVGGLHSHLSGNASDAYLRLVLFPLVAELRASKRKVAAICGNLGQDVQEQLFAILPECGTIGPLSPRDFERVLKGAGLLITSPGSTTILQAMALRLPTLLLPPQNLSQIFNARLYAHPDTPSMQWPTSVLDPNRIETLRPGGENAVLDYIYRAW
jgi:hydroxymethylcytosylglucuronate/cytosylglucuronate synthase